MTTTLHDAEREAGRPVPPTSRDDDNQAPAARRDLHHELDELDRIVQAIESLAFHVDGQQEPGIVFETITREARLALNLVTTLQARAPDDATAERVAALGYELWQTADGRQLVLDGTEAVFVHRNDLDDELDAWLARRESTRDEEAHVPPGHEAAAQAEWIETVGLGTLAVLADMLQRVDDPLGDMTVSELGALMKRELGRVRSALPDA